MVDADRIRRIVRQYLTAEQALGLREVPIPAAEFRAVGSRKATATPRTQAPGARIPSAAPANEGDPPQATSSSAPPRVPIDAAAVADRAARLQVIDEQEVRGCQKCGLAATRTRTVFGQGSPAARVVFVGEAPGFEEDRQGLAFVGPAGQLLTRMIQAMTLTRDAVYICNVLKCRPPNNRDPAGDEITACSPYLVRQLEIIRPEVIVALGAPAARTLLNSTDSIGRLRGQFHNFYLDGPLSARDPIPVMPTYHPAFLLRSPQYKSKAWSDLQAVMARLGLTR